MLENLGKKEKIELLITGIFGIFLIFLIMDNTASFKRKRASLEDVGKAASISLEVPIVKEPKELDTAIIKEDWGRDPFFLNGPNITDSGLKEFILNGIVWDKDHPYAIINDDIVKVGDAVGETVVIEIKEKSIILEQDGTRYTLKLNVF